MLNFTKIRPVGTELFHVDGQTEMTRLIDVFLATLVTRLKTGVQVCQRHNVLVHINLKTSRLCLVTACLAKRHKHRGSRFFRELVSFLLTKRRHIPKDSNL